MQKKKKKKKFLLSVSKSNMAKPHMPRAQQFNSQKAFLFSLLHRMVEVGASGRDRVSISNQPQLCEGVVKSF